MIKSILYKKRWMWIGITLLMSIFSLMVIHNYYLYEQSSYSLVDFTNNIPSWLLATVLAKSFDFSNFKGYYGYFLQMVILLMLIYSFLRGIYSSKKKDYKDFNLFYLRTKPSKLYIGFFFEYLIEVLIILLPFMLVNIISVAIFIHSGYVYIILTTISLFLVSLIAYFTGSLLGLIKNRGMRNITSILLLIILLMFCYVNQAFKHNIFAYLSIIESISNYQLVEDITIYLIVTSVYIVINAVLFYVAFVLSKKKEIL